MKQRAGFTLLELLISALLVVTIFIIIMSAVVNAFRDNQAQKSTLAATDKAQQIVRSTVSMIRQTVTSPTGAYPIIAATNSSLTFYTSNGATVQQVRIFLNGTSLQIGRIQPVGNPVTYPAAQETVTTVLTGVQNGATSLFNYYTNTYTGTEAAMNPITINSIRLIKMTVIYDDDITKPPASSTIELQAQLRNLKDNY